MERLEALRARLLELDEEAKGILALADAEKRDLTQDEQESLDSLISEFKTSESDIARMEAVGGFAHALAKSDGPSFHPAVPHAAEDDDDADPAPKMAAKSGGHKREPVIAVRNTNRGRGGWRHVGEFFAAVRNACPQINHVDPRLAARMDAPDVWGGATGVPPGGQDGGYAVPPDFREQILHLVMGEDQLLPRTNMVPTLRNSVTFPKYEGTPWDITGINPGWTNEAQQKIQSKPLLDQMTITAGKIASIVPVTDELLEDAPAVGTHVTRVAAEKINFDVNQGIVTGTGTGPGTVALAGIVNNPATVTVDPTPGQVAGTVVGANILEMYTRMLPQSRGTAVWLVHPSVEQFLYRLSLAGLDDTGTPVTGWGSLLYVPPGGLSASPFATLMGRPVIPTQACNFLGDVGDIIFADLNQYTTIVKTGGIRTDVSIHLFFDYDITAFRFVLRIGGRPRWDAPIQSRDGDFTLSPFVQLGARGGDTV